MVRLPLKLRELSHKCLETHGLFKIHSQQAAHSSCTRPCLLASLARPSSACPQRRGTRMRAWRAAAPPTPARRVRTRACSACAAAFGVACHDRLHDSTVIRCHQPCPLAWLQRRTRARAAAAPPTTAAAMRVRALVVAALRSVLLDAAPAKHPGQQNQHLHAAQPERLCRPPTEQPNQHYPPHSRLTSLPALPAHLQTRRRTRTRAMQWSRPSDALSLPEVGASSGLRDLRAE